MPTEVAGGEKDRARGGGGGSACRDWGSGSC